MAIVERQRIAWADLREHTRAVSSVSVRSDRVAAD